MYVNPFFLGVISTIVVEVVGLFVYAIVETHRRGKK
jgi:hypothetical protein